MFYRVYKNLDTDAFNSTLKDTLGSLEELNYKHFQLCFLKLLNEHAPINPIPTGGGGGAQCAPPVGFLLITFLFIIQLALNFGSFP